MLCEKSARTDRNDPSSYCLKLDLSAGACFLIAVLLALWCVINAPWAGLWFFAVLSGLGLVVLGHLYKRLLSEQIALRRDAEGRALRYRAERDQARADMLEQNQFLASASHDLRQPVYAIGLFTGMLELQLREQDSSGILGKIQQSVQTLSSLFDGILDLSRLDAKAVDNQPQAVCLDLLLSRLQSENELMAIAKGLSLNIDTGSGHTALVDPTLIRRVLMNLVSNAIKFTDEGEIRIGVENQGHKLALTITDTGCGIAQDQIDNIFIEYRQIRSANCKTDTGRGLGLAIVKRLCHLMDTPIEVSSTPGSGTQFRLSLDSADGQSETRESSRDSVRPVDSVGASHCESPIRQELTVRTDQNRVRLVSVA